MSAAAITKHIANLSGAKVESVTPDRELASLGLDSLDLLELAVALEDEFSIEISNSEVESLRTVGDVIALVERKGGAA